MNPAEEWTNVNYIMELVKNEGDADCERAFDFLLAELRAARSACDAYDQAVCYNSVAYRCGISDWRGSTKELEHVQELARESLRLPQHREDCPICQGLIKR